MAPDSPYEAALRQAIADEKEARGRIETMRQRMANAEAYAAELAALVKSLLAILPPEKRALYLDKAAEVLPQKGNRSGTANEAITTLMERLPWREWAANEVQLALDRSGSPVEIGQVYNVLNYLTRTGRLIRTQRGRYMPAGMPPDEAIENVKELTS